MKKTIWILTLFPEYFGPLKKFGVIGRTLRGESKNVSLSYAIKCVQISDHSPKGFKGVDDSPFGGGAGMIIRADVLKEALIEGVLKKGNYTSLSELHVVCPMPRGKTWDHKSAISFTENHLSERSNKDIVFICGRYEGIDERFLKHYVNQFISVGDYILSGGEIAVMAILDSSLRLIKGVLGNDDSAIEESFSDGKLEHALYTRPREFEGLSVPDAYLKGNHKEIEKEKETSSTVMTSVYRKDLLDKK